jgi:hypothetical protein
VSAGHQSTSTLAVKYLQLLGHEDVLRLQVAVKDLLTVKVVQPQQQLHAPPPGARPSGGADDPTTRPATFSNCSIGVDATRGALATTSEDLSPPRGATHKFSAQVRPCLSNVLPRRDQCVHRHCSAARDPLICLSGCRPFCVGGSRVEGQPVAWCTTSRAMNTIYLVCPPCASLPPQSAQPSAGLRPSPVLNSALSTERRCP